MTKDLASFHSEKMVIIDYFQTNGGKGYAKKLAHFKS